MSVFDFFFFWSGWVGDPGKWSHYDLIFAVCLEDQNFSKNENPQKEATQPPTQRLPVNDRAEDRSVGHMPQEEPATKRIWDTVTIRSRSFHLRSEIGKEETHSRYKYVCRSISFGGAAIEDSRLDAERNLSPSIHMPRPSGFSVTPKGKRDPGLRWMTFHKATTYNNTHAPRFPLLTVKLHQGWPFEGIKPVITGNGGSYKRSTLGSQRKIPHMVN